MGELDKPGEPQQPSPVPGLRLLGIGWALTLVTGTAAALLTGLIVGGLILLGVQELKPETLVSAATLFDLLKIAFAVVAGLGGLVALVVAYRRQKVAEAAQLLSERGEDRAHRAEKRESTKLHNDRFTTAAGQLGHDSPAVRLAGVHALAGLADDAPTRELRQTCIDVLCAYLRMPYTPKPPDDTEEADRLAFAGLREVRHTIIRLITAHLRIFPAVSWQGHYLDFTGVVFDGGDFTGTTFSGSKVSFNGATFSGGTVSFNGATFSGSGVYFDSATFSGGTVSFNGATFSGGTVSFNGATFSDGEVSFKSAAFSRRSEVSFNGATFSGSSKVYFNDPTAGGILLSDFHGATFSRSNVYFVSADFSGGTVSFNGATFSDSNVYFVSADFSGGTVSFNGSEVYLENESATFSGSKVSFNGATFSGSAVSFKSATFSDSTVSLDGATFSGSAVSFKSATFSDSTVSLESATFSSGEVSFKSATFSTAGALSFRHATFSGGTVDLSRSWFVPPTNLPVPAPPGLLLPQTGAASSGGSSQGQDSESP